MTNSLTLKFKPDIEINKYRLIEMFFMDYIDNACDREVKYKIKNSEATRELTHSYLEHIQIEFENPEDILAIYLRGIPKEFQTYLEFADG